MIDLSHIRDLRQARQMTQEDLAAKSGITQQAISKIEMGGGNPTASTLARLAVALGVSASELLGDISIAA